MRTGKTTLLICALLLGCAAWAQDGTDVRIESSKTWVGLARVKLDVDDLAVVGDKLAGTYQIRIPFAPLMNDRGVIELELDRPLERTIEQGGRITGASHSTDGGETRAITCDVEPGGSLRIQVDTGDRTLSFKSRITSTP
jgi:hypothetical protein